MNIAKGLGKRPFKQYLESFLEPLFYSLVTTNVLFSIRHKFPLSYFSFQPVLHDWCNKGRGMCYPVCGMVHIKEPLLLIDKSSLCGSSGFPFSLSEWSFTIFRHHITILKCIECIVKCVKYFLISFLTTSRNAL